MQDKTTAHVMMGIGGFLFAIGFYWGVIRGYYPGDTWKVFGLLIVGLALLWFGNKRRESIDAAATDAEDEERFKQP